MWCRCRHGVGDGRGAACGRDQHQSNDCDHRADTRPSHARITGMGLNGYGKPKSIQRAGTAPGTNVAGPPFHHWPDPPAPANRGQRIGAINPGC